MKTKFFIIILLYMCGIGCMSSEPDLTMNNPKIKAELELKKAIMREEAFKLCKEKNIIEASYYVDSLISDTISYQLSDTIFFPEKPEKYGEKNTVIINYSFVARPIFDQ